MHDANTILWGAWIRWTGTMDWNNGMERWNGTEWNGIDRLSARGMHSAHPSAFFDD